MSIPIWYRYRYRYTYPNGVGVGANTDLRGMVGWSSNQPLAIPASPPNSKSWCYRQQKSALFNNLALGE